VFSSRHIYFPVLTLLSATFLLAGCSSPHAPLVLISGSYFPIWMVFAVVGIVVALLARVVLIRIGIDDLMPLRVLAYAALAAAVAFGLLLLGPSS